MQTVGHCTGLKRAGGSPRICRRVGERLRGVVLLSRERRTAPRGSGRWTQYRGRHSSVPVTMETTFGACAVYGIVHGVHVAQAMNVGKKRKATRRIYCSPFPRSTEKQQKPCLWKFANSPIVYEIYRCEDVSYQGSKVPRHGRWYAKYCKIVGL